MRALRPMSQVPEKNIFLNAELDVSHHVMLYPRVSTRVQMKNVSAEMQQDKTFALLHGWTEDLIIMDTSDLGLSGYLRMEDRPAFVRMLRLVADGAVKTIIVAQVDRLFRDRWGQEYCKFIEICCTYGVKVATLTNDRKAIDFVYDFSISWHVNHFRQECEAAGRYIEKQIHRMNAARDELARTGHWAGGALNVGYVPDKREVVDGQPNPKYLVYIPYAPHVPNVVWLFERFRQLEGSVRALFVEVKKLPYLFVPFDDEVEPEVKRRLLLKKVFDEQGKLIGYTIGGPKALASILSHPNYIGYWLHKGQIVSTNHHDAIIDFELFIYAFERLSPFNLDGSPNRYYREKIQHYVKRNYAERPAYLKNHVVCANPSLRVYEKSVPGQKDGKKDRTRTLYAFIAYKDHTTRAPKYSLPVEEVDGIFFEQLKERLDETETFPDYLDYEEAELRTHAQLSKDIDRDIKAVETVIKKIETQVAAGVLTDPNLLKAANDPYILQNEELDRLKARRRDVETNSTRVKKRRTYKQVILQLKSLWTGTYPPERIVPPEELPLLVDTFATVVEFECYSNHFYRMSIFWRDPNWGIEDLLCFRPTRAAPKWSKEEDQLQAIS